MCMAGHYYDHFLIVFKRLRNSNKHSVEINLKSYTAIIELK